MPSNAGLIEMHLDQMLRETGQAGTVHWDAVLAYCIGYYDEHITMDHLIAINELTRRGMILK